MSRAEQIIRKRIAHISKRMDGIIEFEVEADMDGYQISAIEHAENDKLWNELFDRRVELIDLLAEIMEVDYMEALHSL